MTKIVVNPFCLRQTASSKYSHYEGSWDELITLVSEYFPEDASGEVVAVDVPVAGFFSGVVKLTEGCTLQAEFSARRKDEEPYTQVTVVGGMKLPAASVKIILYSHESLAKDGDASSDDAEWEVISINASATALGEPLTPVAMARNFLGMAGGTKREYSAEEFAEAIIFWTQHAMAG